MDDSQAVSPPRILEHFSHREAALVAELSGFVSCDTPTGDSARIREFVRSYRELLEEAGLECEEIESPAGPHLLGENPGEEPALVLVGHSDTVWPEGEPGRRPPEERDGRLYGPGSYDMRAGLCLILWALRYLRENEIPYRRRLLVFLSADEETGSASARPEMDLRLPRDATALVPEPPCPDGSLKIARKGVAIFHLEVAGREAHAGADPERGVSAVAEVARLALELESWKDPQRGILVNVGTIEGGTATNVVPGSARCGVDIRYDRPQDGEVLERRVRGLRTAHPEARLEVSGGIAFPPLVSTERSRSLSARATKIAARYGLYISQGRSGGGSDGSHLSSRGLTVIDGLGVDGGGAHARNEHVVVGRLALRAAFFTGLVLDLGEFPEES